MPRKRRDTAAGDYSGQSLSGVDFSNEDLSGSNFSGCSISGCDFSNADVEKSSFDGSALTGCDFSNADLQESSFVGARLSGCDFGNADLDDADFTDARVTGCDFRNASTDGCTGLDLPKSSGRGVTVSGVSGGGITIGNSGVSFVGGSIIGDGFVIGGSRIDMGWLRYESGSKRGSIESPSIIASGTEYDDLDTRLVDLRFTHALVRAECIGGRRIRVSLRTAESNETGEPWETTLEEGESIEILGGTLYNQLG